MKVYNWSNDEIIVTGDTAVVPVKILKEFMLSYTNSVRGHIANGVYNDEDGTRKWVDGLDDVYFEIAKEHRELIEARNAQKEIPF